jgi:hypothetical protein
VTSEELVRLVDGLEDAAAGAYLTLDHVASAAPDADLVCAIAESLLLVDYRQREDGTAVTLCRLNRRHPVVMRLTAW